MKNVLKPVHLIHLLLFAPTTSGDYAAPIYGRTRLMKMIFIFEKELANKFQDGGNVIDFDFEAFNFGPYSKKVFEAIDFLETRGIIKIITTQPLQLSPIDIEIDRTLAASEAGNLTFMEDDFFSYEGFQLTKQGIQMMKDKEKWFAWSSLSEEKKNILVNFKTTMVNTPLRSILRYVYSKYPQYAEKSIIVNRIFPEGI